MPQAPLPPNVMNAAGTPPGAPQGAPQGALPAPAPGLPQEQALQGPEATSPAGAMGQLPPGIEQKLERIATILISITPDLLQAAMSEDQEGAGMPQALPSSLTNPDQGQQGMPTGTLADRGMPTQLG